MSPVRAVVELFSAVRGSVEVALRRAHPQVGALMVLAAVAVVVGGLVWLSYGAGGVDPSVPALGPRTMPPARARPRRRDRCRPGSTSPGSTSPSPASSPSTTSTSPPSSAPPPDDSGGADVSLLGGVLDLLGLGNG